MKTKNLLIVLTLLIIGFACNEKDNINPLKQEESSLKFSEETISIDQINTVPFEIHSAGIYEKDLYMSVSYTGGEVGHEFLVNWDGNVITDDYRKKIKLNIFHLTDDDNGTNQIVDSLFLSISELNIPDDLYKDDSLWYDVVNTTNTENHFLFQANPTVITDDDGSTDTGTTDDVEMIVISSSCDMQGVWNELWLKNAEDSSDMYYFPLEIDESINYTPMENDKLKIDFEYTYFTDSTVVYDCDFWFEHRVFEIKITDLEVIDQ